MSKKDKKKDCDKCVEYLEGWKRALADYDNLKKELSAERVQMRQTAVEDMIQSILPVIDNFDQAVKYQPEDLADQAKSWLSGIMHVRGQLEGVMNGMGAQSYGQAGEQFDPNLYDAVDQVEEQNKSDQEIIEVIQRGWKSADKIIRPAKVIVNNLSK